MYIFKYTAINKTFSSVLFMATKPKTEISYVFCLHPENISQNTEIFSFLLIEKKQVGTNYKTYHLEEDIFETYKFHGSVKKVFEEFTPEYIDFNINEIQKFLKKQKIDLIPINTNIPYIHPLREFFYKRMKLS